MSSSYGENIHLTIFGQSHSAAIGMTLEGMPAGCKIDFKELSEFLKGVRPVKTAILHRAKKLTSRSFCAE